MIHPIIEKIITKIGNIIFFFELFNEENNKHKASGTQAKKYILIIIGITNKNHPELLPVSLLTSCEKKLMVTIQINTKQNTKLVIEMISSILFVDTELSLLDI